MRFRWIAVGQVLLWAAIGGGAFLLLAKSVQNSSEFGRLQPWILLLEPVGVIALTGADLTRKMWRWCATTARMCPARASPRAPWASSVRW